MENRIYSTLPGGSPTLSSRNMSLPPDYHMHTPRCKHAAGPIEAYVERTFRHVAEEIGRAHV